MKFLASVSALAAFAASAFAQTADFDPVYTPESGANVVAGSNFEVTWDAPAKYADGTVSLHLIGGATQDSQVPLADIAAGIPNSAKKYTWAVDPSLGAEAIYGLVIRYEPNPDVFQYSNPFHIVKGDGSDDTTTVISKPYGIKTVTLSSAEPTSIYTPQSTAESTVYTPTVTPVYSTSYEAPTTIHTKPTAAPTSEAGPETTSPPATVSDKPGAGARFGASSVALVGALVVAAFAL